MILLYVVMRYKNDLKKKKDLFLLFNLFYFIGENI